MLVKEDLLHNLTRTDDWIRAADQKVSIFLAFQGVVLTILIPVLASWIKENYLIISCWQFYILGVGTAMVIAGIFKSTLAVIPRLKNKSHKKSILYFGHIAQFDLADYKKKISEISDDQYLDEVISQTYVLSIIALKKHQHFRGSILLFLIGLLLLLFGYISFALTYGY